MQTRTLALGAVAAGAVVLLLAARKASAGDANLPRWRKGMLECAKAHVKAGTLYQWGGGRDPAHDWGVDCSGLIIDCARKVGFDASGWNSQRMWTELPHVQAPEPGDLALYAPRHVVLVESYDPKTATASIIGSNGGDNSTTSPQVAVAQRAFVRRAPTHLYRDGFLGFATLAPLVR